MVIFSLTVNLGASLEFLAVLCRQKGEHEAHLPAMRVADAHITDACKGSIWRHAQGSQRVRIRVCCKVLI
jgi:hypothetical protein